MRAIVAPRNSVRLCRYGPAPTRPRPHPKRECVALLLSDLMRASSPTPSLPHQMGEGGRRPGGRNDPALAGLTLDSRKVGPGFLFAALAGNRQDGAAFVAEAVKRGAVAILAAPDADLAPIDPSVVV